MPFYKRNNQELLTADTSVSGPEYTLIAANHTEYTYPVDGWFWFDTLDDAFTGITNPPEPVSMTDQITNLVQTLLDQTAAQRGYGNSVTAPTVSISTYDNDPNPRFAADAADFKAWRSACWALCYSLLNEVIAGTRAMPTDPAEILPLLPTFSWSFN